LNWKRVISHARKTEGAKKNIVSNRAVIFERLHDKKSVVIAMLKIPTLIPNVKVIIKRGEDTKRPNIRTSKGI
jgi:uncharacterized membrane protein YhaH (DUF805 family)